MSNSQSKNRTLIFIIALLLITNIAMLVYFMSFNRKKGNDGRSKGGFENILQKEVGFNSDQVARFKALRETHWSEAKKQMEEIKQVKLQLFNLTKEANVSDSAVMSLADSIAGIQKQIEINSFKHFKGTRALCTAQQQPAYDSLMTKIITRMGRGGAKSPEKDKK